MKKIIGGVIATALLAIAHGAHAGLATPASPHAGQEFVLQFNGIGCGPFSNARTEVAGNVITVAFEDAGVCFGVQPPGATFVSVALRAPTASGTYQVQQRVEYQGRVLTTASVGQVVVQPAVSPTRPATSLSGLWYDPQSPGQGLNIIEGDSGQLFLIWFTYATGLSDNARTPATWYIASSTQWISNTSATGPYYSAVGPRDGTAYDAALVRLTPLGIASVTLLRPDEILFTTEADNGVVQSGLQFRLQKFRF